jgi:two-component system phosphate regulon sensor histidine kinase PhoR
MRLSIKIFLGIFLTVLAAVLIGYGIFRYEAGRRFHKTLVERLQQTGAIVDYQFEPLISSGDFKKLNEAVVKLGQLSGARITIIKNDGKVLADSKENPDEMENHAKRPEIVEAIAGKTGSSVRYSSTLRKNMLYVALPVKKSGKISYIVRISMFSQDVNKLLSSLTKVMVMPTIILLLIAAIISVLIARTVSTPIKQLMIASRAVSRGDFSHKVNISGSDEVGELALHFNEMTEHLSDYVAEISSQKDTLNAVVNNISEGVIALEVDGKVQLFNKAVTNLLGAEFVLGKFYWELVREPEIVTLIEKVISGKKKIKNQIEINDKQLICTGVVSDSGDHIIISVFDITDIIELSKIKKDFVTNASHELKTPLTSINGFLDLAMESCDCETNKYLEVVKRNTQRLINIVNDLLTLAELEKKGLEFDSREININSLIQNVTAFLEIKAKDKNLYLKIKLPEENIFIKGDEFKIEQLLVNLIDNAIKYTENGGVTVTLKNKNGKAIISVADTGIGISEKDISRIFERFYVSNKARSRKSGGTGLGLSIVKHIVMIHDGKISVKSKPDEGTEFIIVL